MTTSLPSPPHPGTYTVVVSYATSRPPRDHAQAVLAVSAFDDVDARLVACQVVACRPDCVMPTRAEILSAVF